MSTPVQEAQRVEREPARAGRGEAAFRGHLTVYLAVGLFLFTLNLLTSPGDWWFYWPLFFWGWGLIFQAIATFGIEAPARVVEALRSIVPVPLGAPASRRGGARRSSSAPFAAAAFAAVHERVERLKELAGQMPERPAREQARQICATADRIAAAMAADRADEPLVTWFDTQLLAPTVSLLDHYVRLSSRGVSGAEETLRRVEEQNLPLLASRFEDLHNQLHRGEIVDLAVASEMLELDLPQPPARPHHPPPTAH